MNINTYTCKLIRIPVFDVENDVLDVENIVFDVENVVLDVENDVFDTKHVYVLIFNATVINTIVKRIRQLLANVDPCDSFGGRLRIV